MLPHGDQQLTHLFPLQVLVEGEHDGVLQLELEYRRGQGPSARRGQGHPAVDVSELGTLTVGERLQVKALVLVGMKGITWSEPGEVWSRPTPG